MDKADASDFELEAKRKEDSSWHPCQVFFSADSSTSSGLIVNFGSQFEEEVIFSEEEALERLRFRSSPLQGDDCSHIKEGDHVLASLKTQSKSLFFDCEVEKVSRRHTKKIYCRCTFHIKRLCTDSQDGTVSVTSNAIMKISTTKLSHHSVVATFLNSFKSLTCSNVSSLVTDPVPETDIPIMLEKQIEDIFRSVHAPVEGLIEAKGCLPRATLEESNRAYLSPLGARAALASLMQEQPRNSDVPICHVELEQEDLVDASQKTANNEEHSRGAVFAVTRTLNFGVTQEGASNKKRASIKRRASKKTSQTEESAKLPVTQEKPIVTRNEPEDEKCNTASSVKHLKSSASRKNVNLPVGASRLTRSTAQKEIKNSNNHVELKTPTKDKNQTLDERPEDKKSDTACAEKRLTKSAAGKNVNRSMETTRLTRSTVQRAIENSNNDVELNPPAEDIHTFPSHMTRLTRSVSQKGGTLKLKKGLEERKQAEGGSLVILLPALNTGSPKKRDQVSTLCKQTKMKIPLSSPVGSDVQSSQSRESNKKQRVTDISPNIAGKVTQKGGNLKLDKGLEESKQAEGGSLVILLPIFDSGSPKKSDQVSTMGKQTKMKMPLSSPVESDVQSSQCRESNKKRRVTDISPNIARKGAVSDSKGRSEPELRFSPRLKFVSHTGS
ncbi:hypothetical protein MKW92_048203 [Papaver armeniacum]|nr:hypothetical protein MKW92_052901 [Papaver armeniacum]KAI3948571.1 hypothetical protein MKW92_048203 [Papaver armeniacum]